MKMRLRRNVFDNPGYFISIGIVYGKGSAHHVDLAEILFGCAFGKYRCVGFVKGIFRTALNHGQRKNVKKRRLGKDNTLFEYIVIVFFYVKLLRRQEQAVIVDQPCHLLYLRKVVGQLSLPWHF